MKSRGLRLIGVLGAVVGMALWLSVGAAVAACSNEILRTGLSSRLPDCRTFELVTPPDANGRVFLGLPGGATPGDVFPSELARVDGESFVFSTRKRPLLNPAGANGFEDVYQAARTPSGWNIARRISPSATESVAPEAGGISADHQYIFVHAGPTSSQGTYNGSLYINGDADYLGHPDGSFELTGVGQVGPGQSVTEKLAEGRYISPGGAHVLFSTGKSPAQSYWCDLAIGARRSCPVERLAPNAPPRGTGAVYDRPVNGLPRVVSLLPGNRIPVAGEDAFYQGASADGSVIAFKINGTLYVRIEEAGETKQVTEVDSEFGGLSRDGRYLYYVTGKREETGLGVIPAGDIHRFDTGTGMTATLNVSGDGQLVNVPADGTRAYFISEQQLVTGQGTEGDPNLYVWSEEGPKFVATLSPADSILGMWTRFAVAPFSHANLGNSPALVPARTTPDGKVIVFQSHAQLTDYANAGHTEIYRYDVDDGALACVSCDPDGSPPPAESEVRLQDAPSLKVTDPADIVHNLTEDGSRVFFETTEALVPEDVDGINDIYEWHQPLPGMAPQLSLISSGTSAHYLELEGLQDPNVLMGVTPSGSDVFFRSLDPLVPGAGVGGVQAIYDAKAGGGFPQPSSPNVCAGEACRAPSSPEPAVGAVASAGLRGNGNVAPGKKHHHKKKHRRCRHSKVRRHKAKKLRCTPKKRRGRRASQSTSAGSGSVEGSVSLHSPTNAAALGIADPGSASVQAAATSGFETYGIEAGSVELSTNAAARHPDVRTNLLLTKPKSGYSPQAETIVVNLPPGLYGNPNLAARCSTGDFTSGQCPVASEVGTSRVKYFGAEEVSPVYNLQPPHPDEEVARFGERFQGFTAIIDISVRTAGDYGVTATVQDAPVTFPLEIAETIFWSNPSDPEHDAERVPPGPGGFEGPIAFMTNPAACQSQEAGFSVTSYQFPGQVFSKSAPMEPIIGCQGLPFQPSFEAEPTSHEAGAPTGLKTSLKLPQTSDPGVPGTATMRQARVTLPTGMAINPSAADGLAACSEQQAHFHEEVVAACPDASKLGNATIISPALPRPLKGNLYLRDQGEQGHRFRLWLVSDDLGLHVKIPGEIQPDQSTGQLTAVFADLPQVPVEEIDFEIWGGPDAPLKNPDACGTYQTSYSFTPHSSDPAVTGQTPMTIDAGCGRRGFDPQLHGGATKPVAGAFSPFVLDLSRRDGEQDLAGFEVSLPKGELAKLKGVPLCPDDVAPSGACPPSSEIGSVLAAAGAGPAPLWLPQEGKAPTAVYLAGPYKNGPYSIVSVVPAQAGPFDLGTVVVRSALAIDPETGIVTVKTDPLPQLVEGVPALYRRIHVLIDRPGFTLNPTDCSELAIASNVVSTEGAIAHPGQRFQVDGCKRLGFKPKLTLKLRGGTRRSDYPALQAVLKMPKGGANPRSVSVLLPHSEFLAQEHIGAICTRKQFAVQNCPRGSIYGRAKAWTPLLSKPLEGPVYLRSNPAHELPDLVMDLRGQIEIVVAGRIDSVHQGIRTSFEGIPDAPVSKVLLKMRGGSKSLLTNSTDICTRHRRALVKMRAQNGRAVRLRSLLAARCRS